MNNLILCGFKHAGKTTLGKKIAAELGWDFIDTDLLIADDTAALYSRVGETAFRWLERNVICQLQIKRPTVIALGGGSVLDERSVAKLKTLGKIIYLKVSKEELSRRFYSLPLPAYGSNFEKIFAARSPVYATIADYTVSTVESLWQVIRSVNNSASPHGESPTEGPWALSSMGVLQD